MSLASDSPQAGYTVAGYALSRMQEILLEKIDPGQTGRKRKHYGNSIPILLIEFCKTL